MFEVRQTQVFTQWVAGLDALTKAIIAARILRFKDGNIGDNRPIGEGLGELRIHSGPGYRLYYVRRGRLIYVLLCGGIKSTQKRDIKLAMKLAKEI